MRKSNLISKKFIIRTIACAMTVVVAGASTYGYTTFANPEDVSTEETQTDVNSDDKSELEDAIDNVISVSEKEIGKDETVYVIADNTGKATSTIVSDHLKNAAGEDVIVDKSDLKDIKNVNGDETFTKDGENIKWEAKGNDIYYQGTTEKETPVNVKITYYLDGKEIRSYSKEEYWKILGVVFQDFALIGLPLAENIAASEEYDENKVRHCLKDTGLEEWVDQLKNGLNEWMSASEGTAPSGGEKQRLALARAQYRDPFLMVLDEPTAALDPVAESKVFQKCREIAGGTSAVYISHRLSACRFTDRILVFDEGSIVQEGSHDELAKQRGSMYAQLWQAQAQYYI